MPLTFSNGSPIPFIGFGTNTGPVGGPELETVIDQALEVGYRHFDTAFIYRNEAIIGKVLQKWFQSGKLKREEVFITTKLPTFGVHPDRVDNFLKKSLDNLQLDYVDLYLIHFPVGSKCNGENFLRDDKGNMVFEGKTDHARLWKKMEEQVVSGRTRYIGLSNYNPSQINTILKLSTIKPSCLQVEIHPYLQQRPLVEFCNKNNITVVAFAPLGSRDNNTRMKKFFANFEERPLRDVLTDKTVVKISQKYARSEAQIVLKFLVQSGVVPIPKSTNLKRMRENLEVFDFQLDEEDVEAFKGLEVGEEARISTFKNIFLGVEGHPDFPFRAEGLQ